MKEPVKQRAEGKRHMGARNRTNKNRDRELAWEIADRRHDVKLRRAARRASS